jgi:hypothetical protein
LKFADLPHPAAQMHVVYPDLFRTRRAATDARARMGDKCAHSRELVARDTAPWPEITFQPPGQGQRISRGWVRTCDVDTARADLAARFGMPVHPGCRGSSMQT